MVTEPQQVEITVRFNVHEPEVLTAFAKERYASCWGDTDWEPENLAKAVYEAVLASNMNPSYDVIGLEVVDSDARIL